MVAARWIWVSVSSLATCSLAFVRKRRVVIWNIISPMLGHMSCRGRHRIISNRALSGWRGFRLERDCSSRRAFHSRILGSVAFAMEASSKTIETCWLVLITLLLPLPACTVRQRLGHIRSHHVPKQSLHLLTTCLRTLSKVSLPSVLSRPIRAVIAHLLAVFARLPRVYTQFWLPIVLVKPILWVAHAVPQ